MTYLGVIIIHHWCNGVIEQNILPTFHKQGEESPLLVQNVVDGRARSSFHDNNVEAPIYERPPRTNIHHVMSRDKKLP